MRALNRPESLVFERRAEPREGAFSISVPQGWSLEGGISRVNLTQQMIDAQSIEAKLDLTVKRDAVRSAYIRWCPEIKYCDTRMSIAGMMGMFRPGSNYQGMIVYPLLGAVEFLKRIVFPWAHPGIGQGQVVSQGNQPLLCQQYRQRMAALRLPTPGSYDGGMVTWHYVEQGVPFREEGQAVIENLGPAAAGMWSNKDTVLWRAPQDEFEAWEPILHHIRDSLQIDFRWLAREAASQEILSRSFLNAQQASMARDRRMLEIQQQLQQMDRQIAEHRQRANARIQDDAYLNLTGQEEYLNPHTNRPELGSNQWNYRWVTADGHEFYSNSESDDPGRAALLNRSDWKLTPIRPR